MTILVAVAVGVPCLSVLVFLGMRRIQSLPFTQTLAVARGGDQRGIALQTVIIMVVMLAIAGGIAAVLLTRGQQTSAQLENQAIGVPAGEYESRAFCRGAGHDWDESQTSLNQKCAYKTVTACTNAGGVVSGASKICTIDGVAYRIT